MSGFQYQLSQSVQANVNGHVLTSSRAMRASTLALRMLSRIRRAQEIESSRQLIGIVCETVAQRFVQPSAFITRVTNLWNELG